VPSGKLKRNAERVVSDDGFPVIARNKHISLRKPGFLMLSGVALDVSILHRYAGGEVFSIVDFRIKRFVDEWQHRELFPRFHQPLGVGHCFPQTGIRFERFARRLKNAPHILLSQFDIARFRGRISGGQVTLLYKGRWLDYHVLGKDQKYRQPIDTQQVNHVHPSTPGWLATIDCTQLIKGDILTLD
jgi:hypothetical protein